MSHESIYLRVPPEVKQLTEEATHQEGTLRTGQAMSVNSWVISAIISKALRDLGYDDLPAWREAQGEK